APPSRTHGTHPHFFTIWRGSTHARRASYSRHPHAPLIDLPPLFRRARQPALASGVAVQTHLPVRAALIALAVALLAVLLATQLLLPSARVRAQSALGSCGDPSAPYAEVQIDALPRVNLQLAQTEQQREQGLMYVDNLPPD